MPRAPKHPTAFPSYCDEVWAAVRERRLPITDERDPAGYPNTQYLDFPDRSSCEAARHNITKFRYAIGMAAKSMPNRGKPGSDERKQAESRRLENLHEFNILMRFSVSPRNMLFPLERRFGKPFYSLPDGPHRLYFTLRGIDLASSITSQFLPRSPEETRNPLVGTPISPASRALKDLGYSTADDPEVSEVPISEEETFAEEEDL